MLQKEFRTKVIGARIKKVGWFFKEDRYYITLKFVDYKNTIVEKMVTWEDYCQYNKVGMIILVTMQSTDGKTWNFIKKA